MMAEWGIALVWGALIFGALWGSFFNVAIHRWPRGMSVIKPPSHCPACGARVPWYWNLPIVGYFLLKGKAACCGARLSPRYLIVEIIGAVVCAAVVQRFWVWPMQQGHEGGWLQALLYFVFGGGLIVATFVDLEWMEIPDEVSLPWTALGLSTFGLRSLPAVVDPDENASVVAMGAGLGFLLIQVPFVWLYEAAFDRRGMGEGDSKLLMMIGAFLGWKAVLFSLVLGAFQGLFIAGVLMLTGKSLKPQRPDGESMESEDEAQRLKMPFGPCLALGALEFLFFGDVLVERYQVLLNL